MTTPDMRKARLLEAVKREPSPSRREVVRQEVATVLAAAIVPLVIFFSVGGLSATLRPHRLLATTAVVWLAIALVATRLALQRGRAMLGAPRGWLALAAASTPVFLAASWFALPWAALRLPSPRGADVDAVCFAVAVAMAAAPLGALLFLRREGDPVHPTATGAIAGAAAGAWACLLIGLHCEATDPRHVAVGHVVPVVFLTLAGALAARRALGIRSASPRSP